MRKLHTLRDVDLLGELAAPRGVRDVAAAVVSIDARLNRRWDRRARARHWSAVDGSDVAGCANRYRADGSGAVNRNRLTQFRVFSGKFDVRAC